MIKQHRKIKVNGKHIKNSKILSGTTFNNELYLSVFSGHNYLVKLDSTCDRIVDGEVDHTTSNKIKTVSGLKGQIYAVSDKGNNLYMYDRGNDEYLMIKTKCSKNMLNEIVEAIRKKYHGCKCHDCYDIFGVVELHEINIFVQLVCKHSNKKIIYVIRTDIDVGECEFNKPFEVVNEYDYSLSCEEMENIDEKFVGVTVHDDKIYLVSANDVDSGTKGNLWAMDYYRNISHLGMPRRICKLKRQPKCVISIHGNLIIPNGDIKNNILNYYIFRYM